MGFRSGTVLATEYTHVCRLIPSAFCQHKAEEDAERAAEKQAKEAAKEARRKVSINISASLQKCHVCTGSACYRTDTRISELQFL